MTAETTEPTTPNPITEEAPNAAPAKRDWGEWSYPISLVMLIVACALLPAISLFGYVKYLISGDG